MRLVSFAGRGIYDLFDLDVVSFFDEVTFLTGINGSGKTTAVYTIFSLLTPNLHNLARIRHSMFSLSLENEGMAMEIRSSNNGKILTLQMTHGDGPVGEASELSIAVYPGGTEQRGQRFADEERQYYQNEYRRNFDSSIIQRIRELPTPMFLDLERLHYEEWERPEPMVIRETQRSAVKQSFVHSLVKARELADRQYREVQVEIRKYTEDLKKTFIKTALSVNLNEPERPDVPGEEDLSARLSNLKDIIKQLDLGGESLLQDLATFFQDMKTAGNAYAKAAGVESEEDIDATLLWLEYRQRYAQLQTYLDTAVEYNQLIEGAKKPITDYLALVNRFLKASDKELFFDEKDRLRLKIGNTITSTAWVSTLSSGEGQLFALLTNITLGSETEKSRVCIIDEPEVSLHVLWQELFVSAVREADPKLQLILATHSPSIINGDNDHCRNLRLRPTEIR